VWSNVWVRVALVVLGFCAADVYRMWAKQKHSEFVATQREVTEEQLVVRSKELEAYIEERSSELEAGTD
jgi:hypothetical protein